MAAIHFGTDEALSIFHRCALAEFPYPRYALSQTTALTGIKWNDALTGPVEMLQKCHDRHWEGVPPIREAEKHRIIAVNTVGVLFQLGADAVFQFVFRLVDHFHVIRNVSLDRLDLKKITAYCLLYILCGNIGMSLFQIDDLHAGRNGLALH